MESTDAVTFANSLGAWLAPALLTVRATGFFEWYVYIPTMTVLSLPLFGALVRRLRTCSDLDRRPHRRLWLAGYYAVCFLLANSLAVAVKTLIIEEIDYREPVWLTRLISPLHFYIASVAAAYLWLLARTPHGRVDWVLVAYVQVGLVGGYAVALYRVVFERFSLADPTMALGGLLLGLGFAAYNVDLGARVRVLIGRHRGAARPAP